LILKIAIIKLTTTDIDTGEVSCSLCGVVLSDKIFALGPEVFGQIKENLQNNERTGQKISLKMADMGLSTVIQPQDKDSSGKSLSNDNKRTFYRLRMWDRNSRHEACHHKSILRECIYPSRWDKIQIRITGACR
jgi:transcription initiation factor TFIIIB Brf1 subunit/transcription initiation factor TFIIB